MDVFDALEQEYAAINAMLRALDAADWRRDSLCAGWSVADVVLHLAQTEEGVVRTTSAGAPPAAFGARGSQTVDDAVGESVAAERGQTPSELLDRWTRASRASLEALRAADPAKSFAWATNPLRPRTLATTRLSEHWIHANDIAQPLGLRFPDTERLWHIARLAHRTIPYAYARAGRADAPTARVELDSPAGKRWEFGEPDAGCTIRGSASEFCRIAARRLPFGDATTITVAGERGEEVLDLIRTYA